MKALVCLAAFLITLGSAHAIDNMVRGETFDGETGLKTGAQLEDLVTESYWSSGAFATNNAIRLFDASQFELGTDTTGITGTNVATIKAGGITTTEILDGTIGTNDLSSGVIELLGSTEYSEKRGGFPLITLNTNMVVLDTSTGGTLIDAQTYTEMFDQDFGTMTSTGLITTVGGMNHQYNIDLGALYSGIIEVKLKAVYTGVNQAIVWVATGHDAIGTSSSLPEPHEVMVEYTGAGADDTTWSRLFTGRYLTIGVEAVSAGTDVDYNIFEIALWGATNSYSSLGGF